MTSSRNYQKGLTLRDIARLTTIEIDRNFRGPDAILMLIRVAGRMLGLRMLEVSCP